MFVIRGTTVSAEHVSGQAEPLNLKEFIYELDVPVIVGGCATYQAALHLMRTGAAGVLVGFGGGAAHTTRTVLGVAVPMATAVADVAAARRDYLDESGGRYVHVIADGSIGKSGDIAKAIACGADAVMVGSPLARATDAPGRGFHWGAEAHHHELPRGERVEFGTVGTLEEILLRPVPRRRRHDEPDRRAAARRWPPPATPSSRSSSGSRSSSSSWPHDRRLPRTRRDTADVAASGRRRWDLLPTRPPSPAARRSSRRSTSTSSIAGCRCLRSGPRAAGHDST